MKGAEERGGAGDLVLIAVCKGQTKGRLDQATFVRDVTMLRGPASCNADRVGANQLKPLQ